MRLLLLVAPFMFATCQEKSTPTGVKKLIPDSTGSFYATQFFQDYKDTRAIENTLKLPIISNGSDNTELRFWNLSSSYDPQSIYILRKIKSDEWKLRVIRYYSSSNDSIVSDTNMFLRAYLIDLLDLQRFWNVSSQSELVNGDSFGCVDDNTVLLELADASRYKYVLFRCPKMHVAEDSAFYYVSKLSEDLRSLAKGN